MGLQVDMDQQRAEHDAQREEDQDAAKLAVLEAQRAAAEVNARKFTLKAPPPVFCRFLCFACLTTL